MLIVRKGEIGVYLRIVLHAHGCVRQRKWFKAGIPVRDKEQQE